MEAIKEFFRFILDYLKSNIRRRRLITAEKLCLIETNKDRRKRWIIRGKKDTYVVFTKVAMQHQMDKRTLKKNLTAKEMDEIADSIIVYNSKTKKAFIWGKQRSS